MKSSIRNILFLALFVGLGLAIVWTKRNELIQPLLEQWANCTQPVCFNHTLKIEGFDLKSNLHVSIAAIRGTWQTAQSGFPFEIKDVAVIDPVTNFIFRKPVRISFQQFRPQASKYPGLEGRIVLLNDKAGTFELETAFMGLYLEELTAVNPKMLKGSSGRLTGTFYVKTQKSGKEELKLRLIVIPPGGRLQARFFDVLLPYLPSADKKVMEEIRKVQTVVYKEANVAAELEGKNSLKVLLNIQVPEYNLTLNLNLTLRVEDSGAFFQLTQLLGLAKAGKT